MGPLDELEQHGVLGAIPHEREGGAQVQLGASGGCVWKTKMEFNTDVPNQAHMWTTINFTNYSSLVQERVSDDEE